MVEVMYFAWVRERIGLPKETVTTEAKTVRDLVAEEGAVLAVLRPLGARQSPQIGVGTQNGPRYTLRFCRAFDGAHLAKRSERGGWRIGIGPEVIAGEIDMLPTER